MRWSLLVGCDNSKNLIPIRDINPRVRVPVVNYGLMVMCVLAFLFQLSVDDVDGLVRTHGAVPGEIDAALRSQDPMQLWRELQAILTSLFLHGSWFHIIGNLLYLRVFGDNVEDRFGHAAFLVFYLASGVAGAMAQYAFDPSSATPVIGASGAIAGVLGAYMILCPTAKIMTLFPVFIFLTFIEVPAFFFLGLWAAMQLLNGYAVLGREADPGIAWFCHLGGFALGLAAGLVHRVFRWWRRRKKR
jgi:membrane associated rhomboid family serine protease